MAIKIGSEAKENSERVKGLVRLAVGNDSLKDYTHFYEDGEKRISIESTRRSVKVNIFYKNGRLQKEIYSIPYSKLNF